MTPAKTSKENAQTPDVENQPKPGKTAAGKSPSPSQEEKPSKKDANGKEQKVVTAVDEEKSVWTKEEIKLQIKALENRLEVALKQNACRGEAEQIEKEDLEPARSNFYEAKFVEAQKNLMNAKIKEIQLVNTLSWERKLAYFVSIWGIIPISTAFSAMLIAFLSLTYLSDHQLLGVVPLWAPLIAVMGASVQIFVGVAKDYKADGMITDYRSLWYLVIVPVSFAFGFMAYFLIQAGLITVTQGQFMINPNLNQTVSTLIINQTVATGTNQTVTTEAFAPTNANSWALPVILCFLAGYATDWFMDLLGNLTKPRSNEKK